MSLNLSLPCDNIVVLGRADIRSHALAFDWTNSGVFFRFYGKQVTFHFDAPALNQTLYVRTKLDNHRSKYCVCADSLTVTVTADRDAEHTIYLVRVNEILDAVPLVMTGIVIDGEAPKLADAPALPDRRMLFLGDSITCGFGILTDGAGNGFKTVEQDGSQTYAALAAAHFEAQAHFVCISGRGVIRNCDDYPAERIPDFFEHTTISNPTAWDHSTYQPDVVVVNAGTNDTAGEDNPVNPQAFRDGVKSFVQRLREVYPNAKIIWCYGMMAIDFHDAIRETLESFEDPAIEYMPFQSVYEMERETGACSHPNQRAHYRCAGVLIDTVSRLTGWEK